MICSCHVFLEIYLSHTDSGGRSEAAVLYRIDDGISVLVGADLLDYSIVRDFSIHATLISFLFSGIPLVPVSEEEYSGLMHVLWQASYFRHLHPLCFQFYVSA